MAYSYSGPAPAYEPWPVSSDTGAPALRAEILSAVFLFVAGACGIVQLFVPWVSSPDVGSPTGWQSFQALKQILPAVGFSYTFAAYAIFAVVVVGVAFLAIGAAMLFPIDHRPPGIVAAFGALVAVACAVWWAFWGPNGGVSSAFSHGSVGWYLFLATGVLGAVGSIRAIVAGGPQQTSL